MRPCGVVAIKHGLFCCIDPAYGIHFSDANSEPGGQWIGPDIRPIPALWMAGYSASAVLGGCTIIIKVFYRRLNLKLKHATS
jgi:hypothetical protein